MKKLLISTLLVLTFCSAIFGQEVITKLFYKDELGYNSVDRSTAHFYELKIKEPNGVIKYEMRDIKDDKLISLKRYKKDFPVGKWISINGTEINHDSILHYDYSEKVVKEKKIKKFEPPLFAKKDDSFDRFVTYRLTYPEYAAQYGIQGTVVSQFIIDEAGNLIECSILKSADEYLDQEATRVIKQSPKWTPAKLNGKPIKVFVITQTTFVLK